MHFTFSFCHKKEERLKARLKSGDAAGFSEIYERFRKPIQRYVMKRVADASVAEELLQEIFLKVYQYRDSFDSSQRLSPWIWTIARNTLFDHFRKARPDSSSDESQGLEEIACSRDNAEQKLLNENERHKLVEMMNRLPESQRRALIMSVIGRFSYQQISQAMNLSLGAVKSLINRARNSLRKALRQEPHELLEVLHPRVE